MSGEQAQEWAAEYLSGTASSETVARLSHTLACDADFRRWFMEYLDLDLALAANSAPRLDGMADMRRAVPRERFSRVARMAAVIACALSPLLLLCWLILEPPFAVVRQSIGSHQFTAGDTLRDQTQVLTAGILEVETSHGGRVVIEAPAEFSFSSAEQLRLTTGAVWIAGHHPSGDFTVVTAAGEASEVGQGFGLVARADGQTEVHAFAGDVRAQTADGRSRQTVPAGSSLVLSADGVAFGLSRKSVFVRSAECRWLAEGLAAGSPDRANTAFTAWSGDHDLITLIRFSEALLSECTHAQGRWAGSLAADFNRPNDHVPVVIDAQRTWPQVTLAAWVRLDRSAAEFRSLFHVDGWDAQDPGQVHWMLTNAGTLRLSISGNHVQPSTSVEQPLPSDYPDADSAIIPPSEDGKWLHLATVYDATQHSIRFYVDGEPHGQALLDTAHPARFGSGRLGNWAGADRVLGGRMDEMLILGRALNDHQVRELFASGNPYR